MSTFLIGLHFRCGRRITMPVKDRQHGISVLAAIEESLDNEDRSLNLETSVIVLADLDFATLLEEGDAA